ncbi:MAG: DUF262 domain-containing protein [Candidatus Dojkabacteria bacterium]|jgi:hypothetical protein|nr:DUF262 domain-containing protein [Candidatus Dojkabacteria bacterium]
MAQLFKQVDYNLATIIQNIDVGIIGLPDIQREFVWTDTKVRDLFDSMFKGYPVGYFLFWANGEQNNVALIGTGTRQISPNLLIVDGQQRLTSLYAVIKGKEIFRKNFVKDKIVISFKPLDSTFVVPDASTGRNDEYIHSITDIWNPNINIFDLKDNFISKLKERRQLTDEEIRTIQDNILKLKNLDAYPFSSLELNPNITEEAVADIFVKINSQGQTLNMADFILTLMSVYWDEGRMQLESFSRNAKSSSGTGVSPFNYIIQPDADEILKCSVGYGFRRARMNYIYSILRGKDLETGEFSDERRVQQFEKLKEAQDKTLDITTWHEFLKSLSIAGFIREDILTSKNTVLYAYVFFLIGRNDYNVDLSTLKSLIARWFFFSSLTGRYTGSPETVMEIDLVKLKEVHSAEEFINLLTEIIDSTITNDYWEITLPNDLATSSSRSPQLFAYYASLVILGAKGLFSKVEVRDLIQGGLKSNKSALERHHLFPKAYLIREGVDNQTVRNQIANYALVEWNDNIDISDKSPKEYIKKSLSHFSREEKENMYFWHALPENWEKMEYEKFLVERRKLIAKVISHAFDKLSLK